MLFSSSTFVFLFLPFVLAVYYIVLKYKRNSQNVFLFIISLVFYAWGEPFFVVLMLLSIIVNWKFGLIVDANKNTEQAKQVIWLMLFFNLGIMFIFKYLRFVLLSLNQLLDLNIPVPGINLPIGISFFTFQAISYVIDVYRGSGIVQHKLVNVGLYISFFPQLIAGPIVRYQTIANQIINRVETIDDFSEGVRRFIIGFGKKILLANSLAVIADQAFSLESPSVLMAWFGIIAYSLQILYDFSGYSDMAIGLGKMFGFHFMENFDYPYISKSISEFWRRWHISLGSWFRDYVYFPLGGSRVGTKTRLTFNLFVVWLLTGIWHGANWTFIVWGLYYFSLISFEKLTGIEKSYKHLWIGHIYTVLFVLIGWVIFRADTLSGALHYLSIMFGKGILYDNYAIYTISENWLYFLIGLIVCIPLPARWKIQFEKSAVTNITASLILFLIFLISVSYMIKGTYNPFIYFNF